MLNPNLSFEMEQEAEAALADAERDAGTRFSDEDREAFKVGEIERILEERGEGWVDHYEREQTLAALAEEIGELQAEFSTSLHKEHGEYVEAYTEGTLTAKENAQAWIRKTNGSTESSSTRCNTIITPVDRRPSS